MMHTIVHYVSLWFSFEHISDIRRERESFGLLFRSGRIDALPLFTFEEQALFIRALLCLNLCVTFRAKVIQTRRRRRNFSLSTTC